MSSLDPFGGPPSRPGGGYGTFKPRSKGNDGMAIWKNLEGSAKDFGSTVGSQLTGKGSRGWQGFNGILAIVNMVFGAIFLMLSVKLGDFMLLVTAIAVAIPSSRKSGVGNVVMGGVGVVTLKKDITSIKTLHLTLAVVVGLMSCSYTNQVLITRQNDCILAETYMRLDHLETAMHNVRHEELINGIMMRLDHLSTDINHIKDHAEDKVEETKKQTEFKQLDVKYVEDKLKGLLNIAEDGIKSIDRQVMELEYNISRLEDQNDDDATPDQKKSKAAQKAKLRSLRYRQKTLSPRKTALQDVTARLNAHIDSPQGVTTDDYLEVLQLLEKHINDKDIQQDIKNEQEEMPYVKASTGRLERNVYDKLIVGDYHERDRNRTTVREKQRKQYEKFMANIYKKHDNKFGNKERFLHSLNGWLESMPEHCMDDVDNVWMASMLGWGSVALAIVSGYVALTATVVSGKKDF